MIVITGANGFIGSMLVWRLNQLGREDLVVVDSVSPKQRPGPLSGRKYQQFLGHNDFLEKIEKDPRAFPSGVECVLHMGACSSTTELDVDFLRENNFRYTQRLWHWCSETHTPLIYASSAAVYGDGSRGFDDALPSSTYQPLNPYGESKAAFDRWVEEETGEQGSRPPRWYGLRFFNVYGPNEYHKGDMASVVWKAYQNVLKTGRIPLFRSEHPAYKDGEQQRDFIYVRDIVDWMIRLLSLPSVESGIYNMGSGVASTWLNLAEAVFQSMEVPVDIEWISMPPVLKPRYQYYTCARMERFFSQNMPRPAWSLASGIEDYLSHLRARTASGEPEKIWFY